MKENLRFCPMRWLSWADVLVFLLFCASFVILGRSGPLHNALGILPTTKIQHLGSPKCPTILNFSQKLLLPLFAQSGFVS